MQLQWELFQARLWLQDFMRDSYVALTMCKPAGGKLLGAISHVIPATAKGMATIPEEKKVDYFQAHNITAGIKEFENVFAAELQALDTYFISQKAIYSTPDLIERADYSFPEEIRKVLPDEAKLDIRQAGRCLAFDLPTAAGFHILRAVETAIRLYYNVVTKGTASPKTRNWGVYIRVLRKHGADPKIVSVLDQIRDMHRNPVIHPEVFLSIDEATVLFGVAQSAIVAMAIDIQKRQPKAPAPGLPPLPQRGGTV